MRRNARLLALFYQRERLVPSPAGNREGPMRWALILSGMGAAAMLALGFNMVLPLSGLADTLCDLAGVASAVVFLGLAEGA